MKFVVLGDPVDHSLSPVIHQAAFDALGIDASYTARKVDAAGLSQAVDEIRYGTLTGANVTMPHKELAFEKADHVSDTALRTGAVNTLLRRDGSVHGANTDVAGIVRVWDEAGLPLDRPVLVLGAGGAAAAAAVALADRELYLSARREGAASDLARRVRVDAASVPWGAGVPGAVVVNATPLGMHGEVIPSGALAAASGFFEMGYASGETPAMGAADAADLPMASGTEMLLAQAAASFRLWARREAPMAVMRTALEAEVARRTTAS